MGGAPRETPDPEAAEPAALLAACALLRGDGALAGIALDQAEQAWPGHRLTGLLRAAWQAGMSPDQVRECLRTAPAAPGGPGAPASARAPGRVREADAVEWGLGGVAVTPERVDVGSGGLRSRVNRHASPTIVCRSVFSGCQPSAAVAAALEADQHGRVAAAPRRDLGGIGCPVTARHTSTTSRTEKPVPLPRL